jgi:hypothetical protein
MTEPATLFAGSTMTRDDGSLHMIRKVSVYLNGKLFEWFAALNMFVVGAMILIWPQTLGASAFRYLVTVSVKPSVIGFVCFMVGYARLLALIVNGRSWIYGPRVRAWTALISAVIWLQFWISLAQYAFDIGAPLLGLSNWGWLFVGELIVTYRAATDVRTP